MELLRGSRSERETLKAVYRLSKSGDPAHTGDVAERLGASPSTVTTILKRLADQGKVEHQPYRGVTLTPVGRAEAVSAIRSHRIVERMLVDQLGFSWDEAGPLASTFEHALPEEVEERIFAVLGEPASCPHGFPIPKAEHDMEPTLPRLAQLAPGTEATIALSSNTEPVTVAYLRHHGVVPLQRITVMAKDDDGTMVVAVEGAEHRIRADVAELVYAQPIADAASWDHPAPRTDEFGLADAQAS